MAEQRKSVTRRSLLQVSGCAAALAAVGGAGQCLEIWKGAQQRLEGLTAECFLPYEGQRFIFSRPRQTGSILSQGASMELISVSPHDRVAEIEAKNPSRYAGKRTRKSFSLLFELRNQAPLTDGLHRLNHGDFAGHELYLSQVGRPGDDGALRYEAVFG
jgi:hypothetical protein